MNLSLISFHMILVISSPSNSTTGFLTLIFCPPDEACRLCCTPLLASLETSAERRCGAGEAMAKRTGEANEGRAAVPARNNKVDRMGFMTATMVLGKPVGW